MKKVVISTLTGFLCLFSVIAFGQDLSKAEKKALKREIKRLKKNPEEFKAFKTGIENKREQVNELDAQIDDVTQSIQTVRTQVDEKDVRIKELGDEIARMKVEKKETTQAISSSTNLNGLVYKVQVEIDESSVYTEVDPETGLTRKVFTGEVDEDGTRKYTLGYFRDQAEAETFREYLHLLRIKEAKVVAYQDGRKVN